MIKTFYLIRHGQKEPLKGDPPLSTLGAQEAILTAQYLSALPITRLISSPLLRTRQTAKEIAKVTGLEIEINELLKERVNWGDDPDQSLEDFLAMWQRASADRSWQPPVGDSSINSGRRLESVIQSLSSAEDSHVVLVTHGGVTTDFLRNVFSDKVLSEYAGDVDLTLDSHIKECSVTIIEFETDTKRLTLKQFASTLHLETLANV